MDRTRSPRPPWRPVLRATALLVAGGVALTACGGGDDPSVPEFSGSSATSDPAPDPTATDGSGSGTTGPEGTAVPSVPATEVVQLGASAATPDQQPVVDAWVAYWRALVASAQTAQLDVDGVGAVARDGARSRIERYVSDLQQAGNVLGGGTFVIDVRGVTVDGTTATVTSCVQDQTTDVDAATGEQAELPGGATGLRGVVLQQGPDWIVSEVENDDALCA